MTREQARAKADRIVTETLLNPHRLAQDVIADALLEVTGGRALEIQNTLVPDGLLPTLKRRRLKYTDAKAVYYCVQPDYRDVSVGVFGDGSNGAYEWFIWDADSRTLQTSDCGYGCAGVALSCGLVESGVSHSKGDHDAVLAWVPESPDAVCGDAIAVGQQSARSCK